MLYLLVSIDYYIQLRTVDQELITALQGELSSLEEQYGYQKVGEREGALLYQLGQEFGLDPRRTLEFIFHLFEALKARELELFGFNLLIARDEESSPENTSKSLQKRLLVLEEQQQILMEPDCLSLFSDLVGVEQLNGIVRVFKRDTGSLRVSQRREASWKQTRLAREVVRTINTQYKARARHRGILIHGPVNTDRHLLLDAVQSLLFQDSAVPRAPRLHTLFKRRSTFHPFLNSIDPFFLQAVPQYLASWERGIWEDLSQLIWSMRPSMHSAQGVFYRWPKGVPGSLRRRAMPEQAVEEGNRAAGNVCPDRLYKDFYLAFHLYLTA